MTTPHRMLRSKLPATVAKPVEWDLRLYIAGPTPKSSAALRNLEEVCEKHLPGRHRIEIIDLMKNPHLAQSDQILAVPTLVRKLPAPIRKIIGNLSNVERVLVGLDLRPHDANPFVSQKGEPHVG